MIANRCTWHDSHAQCEVTEDLVSYESPDPWTPARLLCGSHLLAAHAAQRQRFHHLNDERPRIHSVGIAAAHL